MNINPDYVFPFSFPSKYILIGVFFLFFAILFLLSIFQSKKQIKQRIKMFTPPNDNSIDKKSLDFRFLFSIWIVLVVLEIFKNIYIVLTHYNVEGSFVYNLANLLPLHICSFPLFFIPLYLFSKRHNEFYLLILKSSLLMSTIFLLIGLDVPAKIHAPTDLHSLIYHVILCFLFFYMLFFNTRKYYKNDIKKFLIFYAVYLSVIFYICELSTVYGEKMHYIGFNFPTPFSALFNGSYTIANIIMLPLTFVLFVGSFYGVFGLDRLNAIIMKRRVKYGRLFFR